MGKKTTHLINKSNNSKTLLFEMVGCLEKGEEGCRFKMNQIQPGVYLEVVYFVTALVPSLTACLASSPGNSSLTAVWISRDVMVLLLL